MPRAYPQLSPAKRRRMARAARAQEAAWKARNGPVLRVPTLPNITIRVSNDVPEGYAGYIEARPP